MGVRLLALCLWNATLLSLASGFVHPPPYAAFIGRGSGPAIKSVSLMPSHMEARHQLVRPGFQVRYGAMPALLMISDGRKLGGRTNTFGWKLPLDQQRIGGGMVAGRGGGMFCHPKNSGKHFKFSTRTGPSPRLKGARPTVRSELRVFALADIELEIDACKKGAVVVSLLAGVTAVAFAFPLLMRPVAMATRGAASVMGIEGLWVQLRILLSWLLQLSPAGLWCAYSSALARGGVLGLALKGATASATSGAGDLVSQTLERGGKRTFTGLDLPRFLRFTVLGSLIAPWVHFWYVFLGQLRVPGTGLAVGLQKMAIDQLTFSPAFLVVTFGLLAMLEGRSMHSFKRQVRNEWAPVCRDMWVFWVPAKLLSFTMVPQHLCLLFDNFMGLFWSVYLSMAVTRSTAR